MLTVKARVRNGRLIVDAPTSLPDGSELDLVAVGEDDLDDVGRTALHAALVEAEGEIDAGHTMAAADALAHLRARRSA